MKGDFSRFTHDASKHYIATFLQQGRVQLDADWNENVVNFLNMLWKQSQDSLGTSACVGDSFRIGKDIPIDHMLQPSLWKPVDVSDNYLPPDQHAYIFLNANDRPCTHLDSTSEKGSLFVENAGGILREFNSLDLSRFKSIYVRFKVIGKSFQIANCPECGHPSKKGEYKHCTNCGAKLKEEEEEEYSNNNNSSNNGGGKGVQALNLKLKLYSQGQENGNNDPYEYAGEFIERADAGGFLRVRFNLLQPLQPLATAKNFDQYDISHISKLSVHWDKIDDTAVCIGLITVEPMALVLSADANSSKSNPWANVTDSTIASAQKNSTFDTYNGKPTIRKEKNKEAKWLFLRPINFNSVNTLRLAISNKDNLAYTTPTLILVNSNNHTLELSLKKQNEMSSDRWLYYIVNIKEPTDGEKVSADDIKEIKNIGLKDLPENDSLYISEILGELNFENNFLISSDTDLNLSARMYINGMLCSMDHWETYLTQKDIPSDNTDYLLTSSVVVGTAENQEQYGKAETISYMVYADVWNRGITHLEDPQIREVALGGPDTATKLKTICQIKLKEIPDDLNLQDKIRLAEYEIKKMSEEGICRLSIVYPHNSSLSNSKSNFGMLGNHLYRIQIHDGGEEGEMNKNNNNNHRGTFKWSKENASVAFAIKKISENEVVLEQGGRRLDNSNVFRIGGLIEIIDDLDELSEQPRGQMRRITHIDVGKRTLSWSSRAESSDQMDVKYLHEPVTIRSGRYQQPELHPKVILWDGIKYVNSIEEDSSHRSISLEDSSNGNGGIRATFDSGLFRSGDYWTFTTRSNGVVESLISAKPMGPKHDYALLALIRKEVGKEIEIIEDLRHTFQPLTSLRAIDIPYDNGDKSHSGATTVQAAIQRLSGGRIRVRPGHRNTETIKDLAIEAGEIYELKPAKGKLETFASTISFNDIYQHQPFLMYSIISGNNRWDVKHEIHMLATDEEGKLFKDPVDDGTRNYAWKGFVIEADENAQISWLAIGDSYTYFERFVKRVMDEILRVIFGVDTDQLKDDSSVLEAWYKKDLRNLSDSGPDLARQAKEHWKTLQNDWDRFVRNVDKQVKDLHEDFEEVLEIREEEEKEKEDKKRVLEEKEKEDKKRVLEEKQAGAKVEEEARELPKPSAQTVNCPNCGQSYPKEKKYAFCTRCSTELPIQ